MQVCKQFGFSRYEIVDAMGFFGGIWALWNDWHVCMELITVMNQSITMCVSHISGHKWLFTVIYTSPC